MSIIFDEKFESVGYDESGWAEVVGSGCTCDENKDTSDVSGEPGNWGAKCLHIFKATDKSVYAWKQLSANQPIAYYRIEFIYASESLAMYQRYLMLQINDDGDAPAFILFLYQDISNNIRVVLRSYHDGEVHNFTGFPILSINTRYRVELKWDATNDAWAWRIDGVAQPNNIDGTSPVESEGTLTSTHPTHCRTHYLGISHENANGPIDIYYDNFAIDNTTWIGSPPVGDDYLKCSHTGGVLVGTWTSPEYDLGSVKTVRVWGDFVTLFVDSAVSWGGIFPGSTKWEDKIDANTRWYELTTPDVAAKLEAKIKWGTVTGVYPNEADFFQILAPEFTARYLQVEIKITDPQVDAHLLVKKLNMKAAYWL